MSKCAHVSVCSVAECCLRVQLTREYVEDSMRVYDIGEGCARDDGGDDYDDAVDEAVDVLEIN